MADDAFWGEYPREWDRDPRLVDPAVSRLNDAYHHRPTGAVVTSTVLRGQWSHAAVDHLRSCLVVTVPGRHSCRIMRLGIIRVLVFLGVTPSWHNAVPRLLATRPPVKEDLTDADAALHASVWAFERAVAMLTGSLTFREAPKALPLPADEVEAAFREAEAEFGDDNTPPDAHWAHRAGEGDWTELRESSPFDLRAHLYHWSPPSAD